MDLIEKWITENLTQSIFGDDGGDLSISGIAAYQPFDGMTELKVVWLFLISITFLDDLVKFYDKP